MTLPPIERMGSSRIQHAVLLLALLLVLPSLDQRFLLDDAVLLLQARTEPGVPGLRHRPLDLFSFTKGAEDNVALMEHGVLLPWWSHPQLKVALLRPVSSLTHHLDALLWPSSALAMHLHSLLWHALLLWAALLTFRRLSRPAWLAGLAFALYALDDARGAPVAWISNRNALVATTLALPVLWLHVAAGERRGWARRWLAAALLGVALLAGEMALAVLGYVLAYALLIEEGSWRQRALRLAPYALVVLTWRALYQILGFGAFGSGAYRDPGREPVAFLAGLAENLPVLLASQLSVPMSDAAFWGSPDLRPWLTLLALVCLAGVAWLALPALRESSQARFWALGGLLALLPSAASLPGERMLVFAGLGGAGLIAEVLAHHWRAWSAGGAIDGTDRARRLGIGALVVLHLVVAPLGLPLRARSMAQLGAALEDASTSLPAAALRRRTLVVVQAPIDIFASYLQVSRALEGSERPERVHWLATGSSPLRLTRLGDRSVRVELERGFLHTPLERHYRSPSLPLRPGDTVSLSEFRARIETATTEGRPWAVRFDFAENLESPDYMWVAWHQGRFWPLRVPQLGQDLALPATDLGQILWEQIAFGRGWAVREAPPWSRQPASVAEFSNNGP